MPCHHIRSKLSSGHSLPPFGFIAYAWLTDQSIHTECSDKPVGCHIRALATIRSAGLPSWSNYAITLQALVNGSSQITRTGRYQGLTGEHSRMSPLFPQSDHRLPKRLVNYLGSSIRSCDPAETPSWHSSQPAMALVRHAYFSIQWDDRLTSHSVRWPGNLRHRYTRQRWQMYLEKWYDSSYS